MCRCGVGNEFHVDLLCRQFLVSDINGEPGYCGNAVIEAVRQVDDAIGSVVLIHGEADSCVLPEHSKKFYQRMCELSKPCDLHIIEKTNHAFLLAEYTDNLTACKIGIDILNQYLDRKQVIG